MLDLAEKIVAGVCAFLVLATVALYLYFRVPSTTSSIFLPSVVELPAATANGGSAPAAAPEATLAAEQPIIDKLQEQGIRIAQGQRLETPPHYQIPGELLEFISAEANWASQLNLLKSTRLKGKTADSRLRIYEIQPSSLMKKLGFQEGDTIDLLDGEILEFNDKSGIFYQQLFRSKIAKLRKGEAISVTLTRKNRPVHLQFRL